MSAHKIRVNKACQNCGTFVEKNYCPNCGQENTDSRQAFHHLFIHFCADLFHYDSSFWRTTKYLSFAPARLSTDYMNGKRKSYVNPFTYYIFVSFISFFILSLSFSDSKELVTLDNIAQPEVQDSTVQLSLSVNDKSMLPFEKIDSIYQNLPNEKETTTFKSSIYKSFVTMLHNLQDRDRSEKAFDFFMHNLPKLLFVYMPIFAFFLWLFHNKRKRHYFDSGIFTLHFFSMVLLAICFCSGLVFVTNHIGLEWFEGWIYFSLMVYITFYFFRGSRLFYLEKNRLWSNIKSGILVVINFFLMLFLVLFYAMFTIYAIYS